MASIKDTETSVDTSLSYKSLANVSSYELLFARERCGTEATVCVCDQPTQPTVVCLTFALFQDMSANCVGLEAAVHTS